MNNFSLISLYRDNAKKVPELSYPKSQLTRMISNHNSKKKVNFKSNQIINFQEKRPNRPRQHVFCPKMTQTACGSNIHVWAHYFWRRLVMIFGDKY